MKHIEMKLTNVLIAIAILINYSSARPTRSLGDDSSLPLEIKVLNEDGLKYGNVFTARCTAVSEGITEIKWVSDSPKNRAHVQQYENTALLTINSIIPMDFGRYTCIATKSDGTQAKTSIKIERNPNFGNRFRYVLDSEKKSPDAEQAPKPEELKGRDESTESSQNIVGSISDQTDVRIQQDFQTYTYEGETVTFTCLINDENRPDVAWTRNYGVMPRNNLIINNTLILYNVTSVDTGYYICSYQDKSTYVYLGLVRRDYPITFVKIPSKAKQLNRVEGESVEMDCVVVGELETRLSWRKHQGELPPNSVVENNKLRINNLEVENYGYYECLGENVLGNFSDFVYLDIKNKTELLARQQYQTTIDVIDGTTTNVQEENSEETTTAPGIEEYSDGGDESGEEETETPAEQTETDEAPSPTESNDGEITNETTENVNQEQQQEQTTTSPVDASESAEEVAATTEASLVEASTTVVESNEEAQPTESVESEALPSTTAPVEVEPTLAVETTGPPAAEPTSQPVPEEQESNQPVEQESVATTTPQSEESQQSGEEAAVTNEAAPAEGEAPVESDAPAQETTTVPPEETVSE